MNYHEFLAAMAAWHRLFDVFLTHFLENFSSSKNVEIQNLGGIR